jgi:drug/metabolite transporter (DMT)-like permease
LKFKDFLWLFVLASLWGPTFLLVKIGVEVVSPLAFTTARCFFAALFLGIYCAATSRSLMPVLSAWKHLLFMALFGNVFAFLFCSIGETMVQSSTAGVIEGSVPLIVALLTALFTPHRSLSRNEILGIVIGFAGIVIVFLPDLLQVASGASEEHFLGKFFLILMAVSFASSFVYSKEKLENLPHIAGVTIQLLMATGILLGMTMSWEGVGSFYAFTPTITAVVLCLGIFGTAVPWCVYFYLIKRGSAAQVSLAVYLLPVIAIILGWAFLDEKLHWNLTVGTAIIVFSLFLAGGLMKFGKTPVSGQSMIENENL